MYFGQYFFVMGIKYTDALSGSIWQNTIPIFTLFMGLLSGLEKIDMRPHGVAKLAGAREDRTGHSPPTSCTFSPAHWLSSSRCDVGSTQGLPAR